MIDVLEPHRRRAELVHRCAVLLAAQGHYVVAALEPAQRVPLGRRIGVRGGRTTEHRHDRRPRVRAQQVRGAERGVVEVRRADQHPIETTVGQDAPRDRGARIGGHVASTTTGMRRAVSVW